MKSLGSLNCLYYNSLYFFCGPDVPELHSQETLKHPQPGVSYYTQFLDPVNHKRLLGKLENGFE